MSLNESPVPPEDSELKARTEACLVALNEAKLRAWFCSVIGDLDYRLYNVGSYAGSRIKYILELREYSFAWEMIPNSDIPLNYVSISDKGGYYASSHNIGAPYEDIYWKCREMPKHLKMLMAKLKLNDKEWNIREK